MNTSQACFCIVFVIFYLFKSTFLLGPCASKDHESCYGYPMDACQSEWLIKNCKRKCGLCQGTLKFSKFHLPPIMPCLNFSQCIFVVYKPIASSEVCTSKFSPLFNEVTSVSLKSRLCKVIVAFTYCSVLHLFQFQQRLQSVWLHQHPHHHMVSHSRLFCIIFIMCTEKTEKTERKRKESEKKM